MKHPTHKLRLPDGTAITAITADPVFLSLEFETPHPATVTLHLRRAKFHLLIPWDSLPPLTHLLLDLNEDAPGRRTKNGGKA